MHTHTHTHAHAYMRTHALEGKVLDVLVAPQHQELIPIQVHRPPVQLVEVQEEVPEDEVLNGGIGGGGISSRQRV